MPKDTPEPAAEPAPEPEPEPETKPRRGRAAADAKQPSSIKVLYNREPLTHTGRCRGYTERGPTGRYEPCEGLEHYADPKAAAKGDRRTWRNGYARYSFTAETPVLVTCPVNIEYFLEKIKKNPERWSLVT